MADHAILIGRSEHEVQLRTQLTPDAKVEHFVNTESAARWKAIDVFDAATIRAGLELDRDSIEIFPIHDGDSNVVGWEIEAWSDYPLEDDEYDIR